MRALVFAAGTLMATMSMALGIAPTRVDLLLDGSVAAGGSVSAELRIEGRPDVETLVDLSLVERQVDGSGDRDAGALEIDVQPPQLAIPAGQSGRVRIVARQRRALEQSRSFYLVAEHLGVRDPSEQAQRQVDVLTRIHLPVHVAVGGDAVIEARVVNDGEQRVLRVANHGRRYQRLSLLMPASAEGHTGLDGLTLARRAATDAVLPGQTLFIPLADDELVDGLPKLLTIELAP